MILCQHFLTNFVRTPYQSLRMGLHSLWPKRHQQYRYHWRRPKWSVGEASQGKETAELGAATCFPQVGIRPSEQKAEIKRLIEASSAIIMGKGLTPRLAQWQSLGAGAATAASIPSAPAGSWMHPARFDDPRLRELDSSVSQSSHSGVFYHDCEKLTLRTSGAAHL